MKSNFKKYKTIAISLGDPAGIGLEVTLKAIEKMQKQPMQFVLFGSEKHILKESKKRKIKMDFFQEGIYQKVSYINCNEKNLTITVGEISVNSGQVAMNSLSRAASFVMNAKAHALVTAPLHKLAIKKAGYTFEGHTEFLEELAKVKRVVMMLVGGGLKVALITRHTSLKSVPEKITKKEIVEVTKIVSENLKKLWKISKPKIGVLGLNPHAGEGGRFGDEEAKIIIPAMKQLQKLGIATMGPYPPDTAFYCALKEKWDAQICMYHDQGLIPLKTLAFDSGINITLGLPFIRTSPDHGTAFDIAGKNKASPSSMLAAIELAYTLSK